MRIRALAIAALVGGSLLGGGVGAAQAIPSPHMRVVVDGSTVPGLPAGQCLAGVTIDGVDIDNPDIMPGVIVVIPILTGPRGVGIGQLPPNPCAPTTRG